MPLFSTGVFKERLPSILRLIEELVLLKSPSTHKQMIDRLSQRISVELERLDGTLERLPHADAGDILRWKRGSGPGGILLLSHMDTVFDPGTLARMPFHEADGMLFGPGVVDMKSSIAMLLGILKLFHERAAWPSRPLTALFTTDEEVGSATSRAIIESEAAQAGVVFCLEPAMSNGAIKTARKGTGDMTIEVRGVAAHAGTDHARGRNAIEELAHHVLAAQALTDNETGTTVNVGVISGGTRGNVVPEEARALVDFRAPSLEAYRRLEAWAAARRPVIEGTQVRVSIVLDRPPMPRNATMAASFARAVEIARGLGLELAEGSTGGGSDANFVSPLGVPVLDGLGPIGNGAHSEREYVRIDSIAERSALLAALMLEW